VVEAGSELSGALLLSAGVVVVVLIGSGVVVDSAGVVVSAGVVDDEDLRARGQGKLTSAR
jgi:hypothetical protein